MSRRGPRAAIDPVSLDLPLPDAALVVVTAHPGSGKTTLLRRWYDDISMGGDSEAVWHAVDTADDDPDHFEGNLQSIVRRHPRPVVFLDDFQVIQSNRSCRRLVEMVEQGTGPNRFVVAQEHGRELPTARLRPNDLVAEVGDADLRFGSRHLERLIAARNSSVTERGRAELLAATEGWALGIVTVLDRLGAAGQEVESRTISWALDELANSMVATIGATVDRDVFDLLVATSILEILETELCREVAGHDSPIHLDWLARTVPFLTRVDSGSERLRLHGLARRGLLTILKDQKSPAAIAVRQRSAADWFEANGDMVAAFERCLATSEAERAADLLAAIWSDDPVAVGRREVELVGAAGAGNYVPQIVTAGLVSEQTGDLAGLQQSVDQLAGADWVGPLPHGFSTLDSAVVSLVGLLPRLRTAAELERIVEVIARDERSMGESQSLMGRSRAAFALYLLGRFDEARTWARSALLGHRSVGRRTIADRVATIHALDLFALLEHDLGNVAEARRQLDYGDELIVAYDLTSLGEVAPSVDAVRSLARAVVGADSSAAGAGALTELMDDGSPSVQLHAALELVRCLDRDRRAAQAIETLDWIQALVGDDEVPPLLAQRWALLAEALRPRRRLPGSAGGITPSERSVLYLLADRTLGQNEISVQLGLSINTVKSQLRSIYQKFSVDGRAEAVAYAAQRGLLVSVLPWGDPGVQASKSPGVSRAE